MVGTSLAPGVSPTPYAPSMPLTDRCVRCLPKQTQWASIMSMQGFAPQTVVETPGYLTDARRIFSEAERAAVVDVVAHDPECGVIMEGTGGVRKVRVPAKGRGKSGGARVVYVYHDAAMPIFLLAAFAKNEKANLTKAECNALAAMVKALVRDYGGET